MKKFIRYKFFSKNQGSSKGIYKSLNCGLKSFDNKKNVKLNLNLAKRSLFKKDKNLIIPDQYHSNKCLVAKANNPYPKCDASSYIR